MKILVIDDFAGNIASANANKPGHHVTTADSVKRAYEILDSPEQFDAVLVDLFMPLADFRGNMNNNYISSEDGSKEFPVGLVFAIKAANKGIRTVICSDANHHTDWICSMLDLVGRVYNPGTEYGTGDSHQMVVYVEARNARIKGSWDSEKREIVPKMSTSDGRPKIIKDWLAAMRESGLFPELSKTEA